MLNKQLARQARNCTLACVAAILATLCLPFLMKAGTTASAQEPESETVLAIVQAQSVEIASDAVREVGGEIIERLDGVKAVGARLTDEQRSELARHGQISRVWVND